MTKLMLSALVLLAACGEAEDDTGLGAMDALGDDGGGIADPLDGGADLQARVDCELLDTVSCKKEPTCRVLSAFPVVEIARTGEFCVDNTQKVDVGCTYEDAQCIWYTSWGAEPASADACYVFGDCQPEGWGHCADPSMRTTTPC